MKINKQDFFAIGSFGVMVLGIILEALGAFVVTDMPTIGMHTDLGFLTYFGVALALVGFVAVIVFRILTPRLKINEVMAISFLQVSILLVLVIVAIVVLSVLYPVIHPTNG